MGLTATSIHSRIHLLLEQMGLENMIRQRCSREVISIRRNERTMEKDMKIRKLMISGALYTLQMKYI